MASTYSTNLALDLMANGDQSGTWGTTNNTNLGTLIEQAISGYVTQAITDGSGANTTITIPNGATGVARNMFIEMTGALTFSTTSLIVPANKKMYFIFNNTTGGFAVTVKVSGQTGVLVPNGKKVILTSNGTDIVEAANQVVGAFGVGGTATMAAINASGNISINSGVILLTAATGAINTAGALTLAPASANPQITLTDVTKGSGYIQGGVNTGGTGAGDYWIFNVPTSRGLSWAVNNSTVLNAVAAGVSIPGTLSVTGTSTMAAINASGAVLLGTYGVTNGILNTGNSMRFNIDSTNTLTGQSFVFGTNTAAASGGTTLMTILEDGAVTIPGTLGVSTGAAVGGATPGAGGLAFPATAVAVANANTLDDYEEGTFTAAISTASGTVSTSDTTGYYTKIGNQVSVRGYLNVSSVSTPSGAANITGLPFTSGGTYIAASIYLVDLAVTAVTSVQAYVSPSGTTISVVIYNAGARVEAGPYFVANTQVMYSATYNV